MRVLIVDGDEEMSKFIGELVESQGGEVTAALNTSEAWEIVRSDPAPDLVLIDLDFPGPDALDLLVGMKQSSRTRSIPVVTMSAFEEPELQAMSVALGAEAFFAKPMPALPIDPVSGKSMSRQRVTKLRQAHRPLELASAYLPAMPRVLS